MIKSPFPKYLLSLLLLFYLNSALAAPIVSDSGYQVGLFLTNAGAITGMKFNDNGELYLADYSGGRILRVASPQSPGLNSFDVYADGISFPNDLAFNFGGRMFVASSTSDNSDVLEVYSDGSTSIFSSGFSYPTSIASFGSDLFVANSGNGQMVKVNSSGVSSPFLSGFSQPNGPFGISVSPSGDLYFTDHQTGNIYSANQSGDLTLLNTIPSSLGSTFTAYATNGDLYVSDVLSGVIYKLDGVSNDLSVFASGFAGKSSPPFIGPAGLAFDSVGNLFVGDGSSVWKISTVPLPGSFLFLCSGLFGLFGTRLLTSISRGTLRAANGA